MNQRALEAARMSARNEVLEGQLKQVPDDIQVAIAERRILEANRCCCAMCGVLSPEHPADKFGIVRVRVDSKRHSGKIV
jgi:hypothetical protein